MKKLLFGGGIVNGAMLAGCLNGAFAWCAGFSYGSAFGRFGVVDGTKCSGCFCVVFTRCSRFGGCLAHGARVYFRSVCGLCLGGGGGAKDDKKEKECVFHVKMW